MKRREIWRGSRKNELACGWPRLRARAKKTEERGGPWSFEDIRSKDPDLSSWRQNKEKTLPN